jgi:hypothetical protein
MRFGWEYRKKDRREFITLKLVMFCAKCGLESNESKLYCYVDGNNGRITKNSMPHCLECYRKVYGEW